jgi:hypothetical protein
MRLAAATSYNLRPSGCGANRSRKSQRPGVCIMLQTIEPKWMGTRSTGRYGRSAGSSWILPRFQGSWVSACRPGRFFRRNLHSRKLAPGRARKAPFSPGCKQPSLPIDGPGIAEQVSLRLLRGQPANTPRIHSGGAAPGARRFPGGERRVTLDFWRMNG